MPTTILLIENDAGFAREITEALEATGYQVRVTGDGKEGLDLAKEIAPAAIVLCVELPKMSGYSICQKLKKDDALRAIPLVLTSAEATEETFEQHRKLKARAEDYLLKPFTADDLVAKLAPLAGQPEAAAEGAGGDEEEVVSLEEELGLEAIAAEAEADLPALDLSSLPDEPLPGGGAPAAGGEDEDLRLLDDAFAGLSAPATTPAPAPAFAAAPPPAPRPSVRDPGADLDFALGDDRPVAADDVDAAAASLPDDDEAPSRRPLGDVDDDADLALGALGGDETPASARDALDALDALDGPQGASRDLDEPASPRVDFTPELAAALDLEPEAPAPVRGASADALRAAGISLLDEPPRRPTLEVVPRPADVTPAPMAAAAGLAALAGAAVVGASGGAEVARLEAELADRRAALAARDAELRGLQDRVDAQSRRAVDAESSLAGKTAELAAAVARADALAAQVKRADADLKAGREEARRAADQLRAAEDRARTAEAQLTTAAEKARAADAQAAATADRLRAAEDRARAAEAAAAAEKARATEATRGLEAKAAELAAAAANAARLEGVEREVEELKTELIVAQGEVEGARSEVEKRGAELKKRITELEAANAKNEERVVKAYLKIKGDEKVRDKARKALAIALQLLEEGLPADQPGAARTPSAGIKLD